MILLLEGFYHFPMRAFKSLYEEQREIRRIKQISAIFHSSQVQKNANQFHVHGWRRI